MIKTGMMAGIISLCFLQHAEAGKITVENRNCVWQGLTRTNQVRIHIRGVHEENPYGLDQKAPLPKQCSDLWITLHIGKSQTEATESRMRVLGEWVYNCVYGVEAEGVFSLPDISGQSISKFACTLDWLGVCQCQREFYQKTCSGVPPDCP